MERGFTVGELMALVPGEVVRARNAPAHEEVRLPIELLRAGLESGRPVVALSDLHRACPGVFLAPETADDDIAVNLPPQKVRRLVDSSEGAKAAGPPSPPAAGFRIFGEGEPTAARGPGTPSGSSPFAVAGPWQTPAPPGAQPHAGGVGGTKLPPPRLKPKAADPANPKHPPFGGAPASPFAIESLQPEAQPAGPPAMPGPPAAPPPAARSETSPFFLDPEARRPPPPAPHSEPRPASAFSLVSGRETPSGIESPFAWRPAHVAEPALPPDPRSQPPPLPPISAAGNPPSSPPPSPAPAAPTAGSPPSAIPSFLRLPGTDGDTITLGLAAILRGVSAAELGFQPEKIPDTVRVTLPFIAVRRQLPTGRVTLPLSAIIDYLDPRLQPAFARSQRQLQVTVPLQEIFRNLPDGFLPDRPAAEPDFAPPPPDFETPFSIKAREEAAVPAAFASLNPQPVKHAPTPTVQSPPPPFPTSNEERADGRIELNPFAASAAAAAPIPPVSDPTPPPADSPVSTYPFEVASPQFEASDPPNRCEVPSAPAFEPFSVAPDPTGATPPPFASPWARKPSPPVEDLPPPAPALDPAPPRAPASEGFSFIPGAAAEKPAESPTIPPIQFAGPPAPAAPTPPVPPIAEPTESTIPPPSEPPFTPPIPHSPPPSMPSMTVPAGRAPWASPLSGAATPPPAAGSPETQPPWARPSPTNPFASAPGESFDALRRIELPLPEFDDEPMPLESLKDPAPAPEASSEWTDRAAAPVPHPGLPQQPVELPPVVPPIEPPAVAVLGIEPPAPAAPVPFGAEPSAPGVDFPPARTASESEAEETQDLSALAEPLAQDPRPAAPVGFAPPSTSAPTAPPSAPAPTASTAPSSPPPAVESRPTPTRSMFGEDLTFGYVDDSSQIALRAIFATEKTMRPEEVISLSSQFPGIRSCLVITPEGVTCHGGPDDSEDIHHFSEKAASLHQKTASLIEELGLGSEQTFTLRTGRGVMSFFTNDRICLAVLHAEANFHPGVREKLILVTRELARMLAV